MRHDLVVRGGVVVDGTGADPYRADVAVDGGVVVIVGDDVGAGRQEVDAEGHVVTPGFIDGHTHMDAQVFWDPMGASSCWHGVTTAVMGNCGFTLAPVRPGAEDLAIRSMERAEDISRAALAAGIDWSWSSYPEFLDAVDRAPKAINYLSQIGHSALRSWAMGEDAFTRAATPDELDAMAVALDEALAAGAAGFSTSRSAAHRTVDGGPVASLLAPWDEVRSLVSVLARRGHGVFELARGDSDPDELLALAVETGVPVTFGLASTPVDGPLSLLDRAAAAGARMFGQSHSRGVAVTLSFLSHMPYDSLPVWRDVRALPLDAQLAALCDPETRRRLLSAASPAALAAAPSDAVGAEARLPDHETMFVLDRALPPHRSVASLARERGVDPVEVVLDLAVESELGVFFTQPAGEQTHLGDGDLLAVMRHPGTVMTFSDSGAHVSQIIDASIQTHLLGHWVRQREAFTLAEAVRMLTAVPASAWGIAGRGVVAPGMAADLNVLDPATVGPRLPSVVADLPDGSIRLEQRADGFRATIVAGEVIVADGEPTGARPGRLLRHGVQRSSSTTGMTRSVSAWYSA